jgi:FkbM family methyltransferase
MVVPTFNIDVVIGIVRDGLIEPWTTRLIQELVRPGQKVVNAGANFGYYSVLCGQIVGTSGKVLSVDANPHIIPYLDLTRYWSGLPELIEVYNAALWNSSGGKLHFHFDPQFLGGGSVISGKQFVATDFESAIWSAETTRAFTRTDRRVVPEVGAYVGFEATTATIDEIANGEEIDLIQLDIEGAEPYALLGSTQVIAHSPHLRIVTEWMGSRLSNNDELARKGAEAFDLLEAFGFRPRYVEPIVHSDGGISVSQPLARRYMLSEAPLGDYVWTKPEHDPWAA